MRTNMGCVKGKEKGAKESFSDALNNRHSDSNETTLWSNVRTLSIRDTCCKLRERQKQELYTNVTFVSGYLPDASASPSMTPLT